MKYSKSSSIILVLSFICLLNNKNLGQNPYTSNYFPHHLGDVWEYYYYDYIGPSSNILQTIIVFDSTDSFGNGYVKLDRYYIDPYQSNGYSHFFIDTCGDVYETTSFFQNIRKIFKNDIQPGEWWIMVDTLGILEIAKCKSEYSYNLFGNQTTIRNIWYYYAADTTDTTTWFHVWSEEYAQNFGLIWRGGGETFSDLFIKGCSIDGVLYGDTTFYTSIGFKNNFPVPNRMYLFQNYPNPFNNKTKITFGIPEDNFVNLVVYNIQGEKIATLVNDHLTAGSYTAKFDGLSLTSGVYFYRINAGTYSEIKRMVLIK